MYWFVFRNNKKFQTFLILISSYLFYGWWDWRFLALILFSTIIDYFVGIRIYDSTQNQNKKVYLWVSVVFNIGILGFFKYYNFFIDSWVNLISLIGYQYDDLWTLNIILPVGISFYTFQTMSYSIDIYYGKLKPTRDLIAFATFVSFFPQLVAGPIERASNLLPQIVNTRKFNYNQSVLGMRLILWGLFKKVVIADSLAPMVDGIFNKYYVLDGGTLILGVIYFSFQIYCDFSGYSDIAIGTAGLFGIELKSNFKFPYFSRNIGEFWRRWHISLSSWFRDYIYIPLGGSKTTKTKTIRNIFIIFLISGLWHGANLTFIIWGLVHSLLFIPSYIRGQNREYKNIALGKGKRLPNIYEAYDMFSTFSFTTFAWIFFRSKTVNDSFNYIGNIISKISLPSGYYSGLFYVILIIILDWMWIENERNPLALKSKFLRWVLYLLLLALVLGHFRIFDSNQFIYFQF